MFRAIFMVQTIGSLCRFFEHCGKKEAKQKRV